MAYIKINCDDSKPPCELVEIPCDISEWLKTVHRLIGAHTIDIIHTQIPNLVLVIDDCGKLRDNWSDRVNTIATKLYGYHIDPVVGDCILARQYFDNIRDLLPSDIERIGSFFGPIKSNKT